MISDMGLRWAVYGGLARFLGPFVEFQFDRSRCARCKMPQGTGGLQAGSRRKDGVPWVADV